MNKELQYTQRGTRGAGFTLIEGIIASGIISTALIVGLSLAYSNLTAAQANTDRITAVQLAREGLEVMRNVRDSNALRRQANIDKDSAAGDTQFYEWDDFFDEWPMMPLAGVPANCSQGDCGNYFDVLLVDYNFSDSAEHNYELYRVPGPNLDLITCLKPPTQATCQVHRKGNVYYQSKSTSDPVTVFYRRILLKPICWDGSIEIVDFDATAPDMLCPVAQSKIGVLVTADVIWQRGDKILEVQEKERLYNWRAKF